MTKYIVLFWLLASAATVASTATASDQPNILFACDDDMSHASCYEFKFLDTPSFDSLAKEGLRFARMYAPSSKCAPSRAVVLTGRNPWQLEGAANHKPIWPEQFMSFVEVLEQHGYHAGFTGKGWNPGIHPEGRNLTGREYNELSVLNKPTTSVADFDYIGNFKQFMEERPKDRPFFFWYGSKEPHRGYEFKSGVKSGKRIEALDFLPSFWGDSEVVKYDILDYAVEVEYFDQHLGYILNHLKAIGELENTLIIATSDNSMPFPRYKGHPHEFATRVPFVVKWPGNIRNPGRVCEGFASFIDIAPTLLQAASISTATNEMQPIQGKSLFDYFEDEAVQRDQVLTGRERNDMCRPNGWGYPVRSLHRGDFVYMQNFEPDLWPSGNPEGGWRDTDWSPTKTQITNNEQDQSTYELCFGKRPQEELYDVVKDPECLNNLARNPEFAPLAKQMKTSLFDALSLQSDPRMSGNGHVFDEYRPERVTEYDELVKQTRKQNVKKKNSSKRNQSSPDLSSRR